MSLTATSTEFSQEPDMASGVVASSEPLAEQQQRVGAWALLGCLFRGSPSQELLDQLVLLGGQGDGSGDELSVAMSMLGLAAGNTSPEALDDEFHTLFVGLGRGELVPYGSWYQTGFLMETPLSRLRDDLRMMGFERDDSVREPEDHVAALSEVMSMMVSEGMTVEEQAEFFGSHIAPWVTTFFDDLCNAKSAVFYRAVGRFGKAFAGFENQYLNMKV